MIDPNTGAGAYLIGGGADGAYILGFLNGVGFGVTVAGFVFGLTGAAYVLVLAVAIVTVASILATTFAYVANGAGSV